MKAAIITMHCPLNYGAVLQTFALQSYIESLGHEVEIINYRPDYIVSNQSYVFVANERFQNNLFLKIAYIIGKFPSKMRRKHIFGSFQKNKLNLSHITYKTFGDLQRNVPVADVYICGSDQIWSYANNAYKDPSYFLDFVSQGHKRVSYAPSGYFPNPLPDEMRKSLQCYLDKFDSISVREGSTIPVIQPLTEKTVEEVLDPVFLHGQEFWNTHKAGDTKFDKDRYILVYPVGNAESVFHHANLLAKKTGLPIYCISASQRKNKNVSLQICPSPELFLSLFRNAAYVLTNSFHGTAFSILFRRQFWSCTTNIANDRLVSLIDKVGLSTRLVTKETEIEFDDTIDYGIVDVCLTPWIKKSQDYLKKCLSDSKIHS